MSSYNRICKSSAIVAAASICAFANAQWSFSGGADAYVGWASPYEGSGATRVGRQFDSRNNELRLANLQEYIHYADAKHGFSAQLTPFLGDNSDILNTTDSTRNQFDHHLAEAYLTEAWKNYSVDFGKWYSFIGGEAADSWANDIYSRSLVYTFLQPAYHSGVRLNDNYSSVWGASLYATQGWNQIVRKTSGESYGGQIRYNPSAKTAITVEGLFGKEGSNDPADTNNTGATYGGFAMPFPAALFVSEADAVVTETVSDKVTVMANGTYGNAGTADKWVGGELVGHYKFNPKWQVAARGELLNDNHGLRFGSGIGGPSVSAESASLEADYSVDASTTIRTELRSDFANRSVFPSTSGLSKKEQTTLNVNLTIKF